MTAYYWDPEDGDNAQAGTSFATRKKYLSSFPALTAADELRCIASRPATSLGTCAFTNNNALITGTMPVKVIDNCDSAWTATANVTATATTTSTERVEGTAAAKLVIATAFATGKAAYRTLPAPLDLSAFDSVSLMAVIPTAAIMGGYLALCSDTTGDVVVETIRFSSNTGSAAIVGVASFMSLQWNKGAPLSNSIQSIAVYFDADPAAVTVILDNIIATNKYGLNHDSLVGKKTVAEPWFWPILSIQEGSVNLGRTGGTMGDTFHAPYNGTSESVEAFFQSTMRPPTASTERTPAGTAVFKITGGWNRTDMSTRTGKSYLSGGGVASYIIARNTYSLSEVSYFCFSAAVTGAYTSGVGTVNDVDLVGNAGATPISPTSASTAVAYPTWNIGYIVNSAQWSITGDTVFGMPRVNVKGLIGYKNSTSTSAPISFDAGKLGKRNGTLPILKVDKVAYSNAYGLVVAGDTIVSGTEFIGCAIGEVRFGVGDVQLLNCIGLNNVTASANVSGSASSEKKIWFYNATAELQNTVERTVGAGALKMSVLNATTPNAVYPHVVKIAEIAVTGSQSVLLKGWARRSSLTLSGGLKIVGGTIKGIDNDVVAAASAAINTWEELTLNVTPTGVGVLEVWAYAYGVIADMYIGDVTWT